MKSDCQRYRVRLHRSAHRWLLVLSAIAMVLPPLAPGADETIRYKPVSREVVESRLRKYDGNDQKREATLKQMFADSGCDDQHLSEQPVKGAKQPNVICILPGSSDKVIIVGAHFDHVAAGDGVVDNWSGASLLPSLHEAVKIEPRMHTYIFIGFTDEEKGELGSHFYAGHMTKEQIAATDAMVNMDTLGLAPTEIWASHSDQKLSGELLYIAKQLGLPVKGINVEQIGSTDSEQFAAHKIPSITIHSLTQETWNARILHTSKDKISAIRLNDYYETYSLLAAYLAFLDRVAGAGATKAGGK
jgi:putative aminopeptidase FrvX